MAVPSTFINKYFYHFCFRFLAGGRCPPDPPIFGWGGRAPPDPPVNGRSSHLIEAAKRGRLDQMIFFPAPLTTRAPRRRPSAGRPTTVHWPAHNRPRYQRLYGTFFFCLIPWRSLRRSLRRSFVLLLCGFLGFRARALPSQKRDEALRNTLFQGGALAFTIFGACVPTQKRD